MRTIRYITKDEFSEKYNIPARISDKILDQYIEISSRRINVISGNVIEKGIQNGTIIIDDNSNISDSIKYSVCEYVNWGITQGFNFDPSIISASFGGQSASINPNLLESWLIMEQRIKEMLSNVGLFPELGSGSISISSNGPYGDNPYIPAQEPFLTKTLLYQLLTTGWMETTDGLYVVQKVPNHASYGFILGNHGGGGGGISIKFYETKKDWDNRLPKTKGDLGFVKNYVSNQPRLLLFDGKSDNAYINDYDLQNTLQKILGKMKNDILDNKKAIDNNTTSIDSNEKDIEDNGNDIRHMKNSISQNTDDIFSNTAAITTNKNNLISFQKKTELFGLNKDLYETYDKNNSNQFQMLALQKVDLNEIHTGAWQGISAKLDLYSQHGNYEGDMASVEFRFFRSATGNTNIFDNWLVYATLKNTTNFSLLEEAIQFSLSTDTKNLYIGVCGKYNKIVNEGVLYKIVNVRDMSGLDLRTNQLIHLNTPGINEFRIVKNGNIHWLHNSSGGGTPTWKNIEIVDHNSNPEIRIGTQDHDNNLHLGKTYLQGMANNKFYHIDIAKIITKLPRKDLIDFSAIKKVGRLYDKTIGLNAFCFNGIVFTQKIIRAGILEWIGWSWEKNGFLSNSIKLIKDNSQNVLVVKSNILVKQINEIIESVLKNELTQLILQNLPKPWELTVPNPVKNFNFLDLMAKHPEKYKKADFDNIDNLTVKLEVGKQKITLPFIFRKKEIGVDRAHYELFFKGDDGAPNTNFIFHILAYDSGQVNLMVEATDIKTELKVLPKVLIIVFRGKA